MIDMEIERKFLVKKEDLPKDYKKYKSNNIIQGFIYYKPAIRIRKSDNNYFLTIKERVSKDKKELNDLVRKEYEFDISKTAFKDLSKYIKGRLIYKKRYYIPYMYNGKKFVIELDIFEKDYKGLIYAEVEFDNVKDAMKFKAPDWFYKDVTNISKYKNTSLSLLKDPKRILKTLV